MQVRTVALKSAVEWGQGLERGSVLAWEPAWALELVLAWAWESAVEWG